MDDYLAAAALAQAIAVVEKDDKLPEAKRLAQVRAYGDRAVEMLRQAIANGYRDALRLEKDTDLDPLRSRRDFKELLEKLHTGKGKGATLRHEPGPRYSRHLCGFKPLRVCTKRGQTPYPLKGGLRKNKKRTGLGQGV
jgi:hypothetical protein